MEKRKLTSFIDIFSKGSIFNALYVLSSIMLIRLYSLVRVCVLKLRGQSIDLSVKIGKHVIFVVNKNKAITVKKNTVIGFGVRMKTFYEGKIMIGENVLLDDYCFLNSQKLISIGSGTRIGAFTYLVDFNHRQPIQEYRENIIDEITIGKNVWIGAHVIILKGVTIGEGSIIGAGAVVTKSIPPSSVVVGNPAKVIKVI